VVGGARGVIAGSERQDLWECQQLWPGSQMDRSQLAADDLNNAIAPRANPLAASFKVGDGFGTPTHFLTGFTGWKKHDQQISKFVSILLILSKYSSRF
jgi:hypothetical protein